MMDLSLTVFENITDFVQIDTINLVTYQLSTFVFSAIASCQSLVVLLFLKFDENDAALVMNLF